jgi:hypothetical protein
MNMNVRKLPIRQAVGFKNSMERMELGMDTQNNTRSFETAYGICEITPEYISAKVGEKAKTPDAKLILGKRNMLKMLGLVMAVVAIIFLVMSAMWSSSSDLPYIRLIAAVAVAAFAIYYGFSNAKKSGNIYIERSKIHSAEYRDGVQGLALASLTLVYEDGKGRKKQSRIELAGISAGRSQEVAQANEALSAAGLI